MSELFVCLSALGCGIGVGVIAIVVLLLILNRGETYGKNNKEREQNSVEG